MVARIVRRFDELSISSVDWPIILMEFPEKLVTDLALHNCMTYFGHLLGEAKESGEKVFTITDLSRMHQLAPAEQRKWVSDWMAGSVTLVKSVCLGGVVVTPSTILRGLITAIYWLVPPPVPTVFLATRREAYARGVQMFENARIPLRPELRETLATRA